MLLLAMSEVATASNITVPQSKTLMLLPVALELQYLDLRASKMVRTHSSLVEFHHHFWRARFVGFHQVFGHDHGVRRFSPEQNPEAKVQVDLSCQRCLSDM